MFGLIVTLVFIGLIAGAVARLLVPGRDAIGIGGTILLGMIGSFVGGFLGRVLFGKNAADGYFQPAGLFGSIVGAIIVLLIYRALGRRRARV